MGDEWPQAPLGGLVQNLDARRIPLSSRERGKRRGAYPYHGATGVMDYIDNFLFEGLHLLVAEDGSVETADGRPFLQLVTGQFWVSNHAHVLRGATDSDTKFLYYALSTVAIRPYMSGSVQAKLSQGNLNKIPVPYPADARDRRAIALILGTLDDRIELNRRRNETLEAIARAIFQSWFVDFDPVRAKAEGRDPSLPQPLAALFPDSLEDSELEGIPKGWEAWRVADIGDVICGKTPSTKVTEYYGKDVPFVTIPDMHGRVFATKTQKHLSRTGAASQPKKTLPVGAICVSCIATPGLVVITSEEAQTNQQINSVVPGRIDETYYWYWGLRDLGDEIRAGGSGGSVLANLSTGRFAELQLLAAPARLRSFYHLLVAPLFDRILANDSESRTLAALRDTLLPKLISGELRVKDAERFLARARI